MSFPGIFNLPKIQPLQFRRALNFPDNYWRDSIPHFEDQKTYFQKYQNKERIRVQALVYIPLYQWNFYEFTIRDCKYGQVVGYLTPDWITSPEANWMCYTM
jgi:hypothetical protein